MTTLSYHPKSNTIVFHKDSHWIYEIELNQCDTPERMLDWVRHMTEKNWVTPQILNQITKLMMSHAPCCKSRRP